MGVAKVSAQSIAALGGSPSSLPLPELYPGLQHSTVDGAVIAWTAFQPYKLAEVTSYHYEMRLGASTGMVFMARKRYDALPAAAKKILDENGGEAASRTLGLAWDEVADEARKAAEADPKQQVVTPTPDALAKWEKITAPISADWVKNMPGGEKVLTAFRTYLAQIKAGK